MTKTTDGSHIWVSNGVPRTWHCLRNNCWDGARCGAMCLCKPHFTTTPVRQWLQAALPCRVELFKQQALLATTPRHTHSHIRHHILCSWGVNPLSSSLVIGAVAMRYFPLLQTSSTTFFARRNTKDTSRRTTPLKAIARRSPVNGEIVPHLFMGSGDISYRNHI